MRLVHSSLIAAGLTGMLVFVKLFYFVLNSQLLFFGGHKQPDSKLEELSRQEVRRRLGGLPEAHLLSPKEKQAYIKDAFLFSWQGYRNYSWGFDENRPASNSPRNTRNGWGATIVDALDTLYIMGLDQELKEAQDYVASIDWSKVSKDEPVQLFETVIRYVGGLLSSYDLTTESLFLEKAVELVDRLLPAFDTPTGIPYQYVNFTSGKPIESVTACLAEVGTIQLEFTRLSELTGNWTYHYLGQHVYDTFSESYKETAGLFPHLVNVSTGKPIGNHITWGGMGDSFYEYLIKQLVVSRGQDDIKKDMVTQIITGLQERLLVNSSFDSKASFLAVLDNNQTNLQMDELACFAPGTLLLAAYSLPKEFKALEGVASRLMHGCYSAWDLTATGLAPEIFSWDPSRIKSNLHQLNKAEKKRPAVYPVHPSYILRPETVESLYYFYVLTKDEVYQDMAWDIFNSIYTYCRSHSGYSGVRRVDMTKQTWDDREESFFFAETLKYLYLIFDDPENPRFPFDKWVFNTEAHPLRITHIVPPPEQTVRNSQHMQPGMKQQVFTE
ncbi:glycoside hydrolase [Choanephora cucurbitarum]|nr:glycoside hydrolase [Choanephora cucurbitarum]